MTLATATTRNKQNRLLLSAVLLLTLAVAGYFYYSVDIFGMPKPAQNLHQQKPITSDVPSTLSPQ